MKALEMLIVAWSVVLVLCCAYTQALAHPGGLNSEGCHTNRKTGEYHCHGAGFRFALFKLFGLLVVRLSKSARHGVSDMTPGRQQALAVDLAAHFAGESPAVERATATACAINVW